LRPAPALPPPPGVDECRALLAYEDVGRELVSRLKYRNHRAALPGLAAAAASLVAPDEVDVVTWAPTTPARRRSRGFDQSELLARIVARRLGRPCRKLLARPDGVPQTGRSAADRWTGPRFVGRRAVPGRVLLVDDVVTTGATVTIAARALRLCGATRIVVLALARTPIKVTTERDDG
jgi:predicted amidophosphoribosyltransferase